MTHGTPSGVPWRPTREELEAAGGRTVSDVVAPSLQVLFCGINPSLYSAAVGHHFARPGNRFWKALHGAGFTPDLLDPFDDRRLLEYGCGVTNLVPRATPSAEELGPDELRRGAQRLRRTVARLRPRFLAVVGVSAYRVAFDRPRAAIGLQDDRMGQTRIWVLPNPSGRTAAYQLPALVAAFGELRAALNGA
ncbi:MAG: G/U mismatch-specific DNA glycosylase [Actinomycetota bacterium]